MDIITHYRNSIFPVYHRRIQNQISRKQLQAHKWVRSPTNPEVQTSPLNFEEIRRRLDDLQLSREGREQLTKQEFISASDSESDNSLSLWINEIIVRYKYWEEIFILLT